MAFFIAGATYQADKGKPGLVYARDLSEAAARAARGEKSSRFALLELLPDELLSAVCSFLDCFEFARLASASVTLRCVLHAETPAALARVENQLFRMRPAAAAAAPAPTSQEGAAAPFRRGLPSTLERPADVSRAWSTLRQRMLGLYRYALRVWASEYAPLWRARRRHFDVGEVVATAVRTGPPIPFSAVPSHEALLEYTLDLVACRHLNCAFFSTRYDIERHETTNHKPDTRARMRPGAIARYEQFLLLARRCGDPLAALRQVALPSPRSRRVRIREWMHSDEEGVDMEDEDSDDSDESEEEEEERESPLLPSLGAQRPSIADTAPRADGSSSSSSSSSASGGSSSSSSSSSAPAPVAAVCARTAFYCPVQACGRRFSHGNLRNEHAKLAHGAGALQFRCDTCQRGFARSRLLAEHSAREHGDDSASRCHRCGRKLSTPKLLWRHMVQVHGDAEAVAHGQRERTVHKCASCPRLFPTKEKLEKHRRGHARKRAREGGDEEQEDGDALGESERKQARIAEQPLPAAEAIASPDNADQQLTLDALLLSSLAGYTFDRGADPMLSFNEDEFPF
jgi:DNA-directed RNA polymerase subunit RPC12/RpoP